MLYFFFWYTILYLYLMKKIFVQPKAQSTNILEAHFYVGPPNQQNFFWSLDILPNSYPS